MLKEEALIPKGSVKRGLIDALLRLSPAIIAMVCAFTFMLFPQAADMVAEVSFMNFDLTRGRPVADQVLTSIVVPGLGILFATLSSSTLSVLRARQQEMRKSLRQEAILLDSLAKPLRKLFRGQAEDLRQALSLLQKYAVCVVIETEDVDTKEKDKLFTVQRGITSSILDLVGRVDDQLILAGDNTRAIVLGRVVGYAQGLVNRLDRLRASRRSTTTFTFPLLHWAILLLLALSLPSSALILAATCRDTSPIVYSDTLVRLLAATITGAPLLLLSLLADLNEPYAGYVRLVAEPEAIEEAARAFLTENEGLGKRR